MLDQFPQLVIDWLVPKPIGRQHGGCPCGCGGGGCSGAPSATHRSQNQLFLDFSIRLVQDFSWPTQASAWRAGKVLR